MRSTDRSRMSGHVGAGPLVASRSPAPAVPPAGASGWPSATGARWVVKRLAAPEDATPALRDPTHAGYWRREAEVARDPAVVDGPGLVPPEFGPVEEDDEGVTVWSRGGRRASRRPGLFVARALGRFAACGVRRPGLGRAPAPGRPARDGRGARRLADPGADDAGRRRPTGSGSGAATGWPAARRDPQGRRARRRRARPTSWPPAARTSWPSTGSASASDRSAATSATTRCRAARSSTCCSTRSSTGAGPDADADADPSLRRPGHGRLQVLTRAEWALAKAAAGEGALAGKFRHPAVAPYLRALQRQFPQIEALL